MIARRIVQEPIGIETRIVRRGDLLNGGKVIAHIEHLLNQHSDVGKIIACVDSECTPREEIERETQKIEGELRPRVKLQTSYVVIEHALEGWLLADPDAIKKYLGPRVNVNIRSSATLECKPKEYMRDVFRKAGKDFRHTTDDERIAEELNIRTAVEHNESLATFISRVSGP